MSNYVGKFFNAVSSALEFNSATLSGAIDIIVVEDEEGHRLCSPFHVRFGKLQLLKSRGIPVNVYINGQKTDLKLRLGTAGEAYFKIPVEDVPRPPESPKLNDDASHKPQSPSSSGGLSLQSEPVSEDGSNIRHPLPRRHSSHMPQDYMSDTEVEVSRSARDGRTEIIERPSSPPPSSENRRWALNVARSRTLFRLKETSHPEYQDHEQGEVGERPISKKEDKNAINIINGRLLPQDPQMGDSSGKTWIKSPVSNGNERIETTDESTSDPEAVNPTQSSSDADTEPLSVDNKENIAIDKKNSKEMQSDLGNKQTKDSGTLDNILFRALSKAREENTDNEVRDQRRSMIESGSGKLGRRESLKSMDAEILEQVANGVGNGLPVDGEQSDSEMYEDGVLAMSLCGDMLDDEMSMEDVGKVFDAQRVTYEHFALYPNILYNSNMMFRVGERLLDFRVTAPLVMSRLAFGRSPDTDFLSRVMKAPFQENKNAREVKKEQQAPSRGFSWFGFRSSSTPEVTGTPLIGEEEMKAMDMANAESDQHNKHETTGSSGNGEGPQSITEATLAAGEPQIKVADSGEEKTELPAETDYKFGDVENDYLSLKPTTKQLATLDLSPGVNDIRFQVASSNIEVSSHIYLWQCDTKIVISDVDGTITRSDVLGQLLPRVGRDWSQAGVAGLYTHIARNGYRFMYLTSRPIGQAASTRAFLDNVSQAGGFRLPNGPIIMSPDRLMESFTREVIRRKPHEFKIGALREIRSLFAKDHNVFHAGFGNRVTDGISYIATGIPPYRIFTVNPQGELEVMKALYESAGSYTSLKTLVGSVFPDISGKHGKEARRNLLEGSAFNDWNFWKQELPDIEDIEDIDLDSLM